MKNEVNSSDPAKIIDIAQGRAELIVQRSTTEDETNETNQMLMDAIRPILDAYTNKGKYPEYHTYLKNGLKKDWPLLSRAIENAIFLTAYGEWQEITKPEN